MTEQTNQGKTKSRRGCLFYGCLSVTACLMAILIAFLLGLYQLKKMLNFYTDSRPNPLPSLQMTPAERDEVAQRVQSFQDAVQSGRPTAPLELSADEINAFISTNPALAIVKDKLYVTIEGSRLKGQVSVPLRDLGLGIFRGRYLNGIGTFDVSLRNGVLLVTAQSIEVKGKPLPGVYMDKIRSQNLAANLSNSPKAYAALNHLQDIQVKDGKLVLVPKVGQ